MYKYLRYTRIAIYFSVMAAIYVWICVIDNLLRKNGLSFPWILYLCASSLTVFGLIALWRLSKLEKQIKRMTEQLAEDEAENEA